MTFTCNVLVESSNISLKPWSVDLWSHNTIFRLTSERFCNMGNICGMAKFSHSLTFHLILNFFYHSHNTILIRLSDGNKDANRFSKDVLIRLSTLYIYVHAIPFLSKGKNVRKSDWKSYLYDHAFSFNDYGDPLETYTQL